MNKLTDTVNDATAGAKKRLTTLKAETAARTSAAKTKAKVKTNESIDKNPLAIVLGGIAIGAIVGALLPHTEREAKVLGKAGKKLNKKARKVADAAKAAGMEQVDNLGLNGDAMRTQFRELVSKAAVAVKAAAQAATEAAKDKN
jgi:hypothetical protein